MLLRLIGTAAFFLSNRLNYFERLRIKNTAQLQTFLIFASLRFLRAMSSFRCCILILGLMLFAACNNPHRKIIRSFYYWKSELRPADIDTAFLHQNEIKRLYVRALDVSWKAGQGAVPVSVPEITPGAIPKEVEIVPVVYIVNAVFLQLKKEKDLENLADKIVSKVAARIRDTTLQLSDEIQIDCDWSGKTRESYFLFLQKIKEKMAGNKLSATIRLHQYRNRSETGVPPVDRGMLMFYNVLNVRDYQPENSIFEKKEIEKYIADMPPYPIALDIVLPLFSWGVVYRNEKFLVLLNNLRQKDLESIAFMQKNEYFWKVVKDTVFRKTYLRYGDEIKIESAEPENILEVVSMANRIVTADTIHFAFYHLDEQILPYYDASFFKESYEYLQ